MARKSSADAAATGGWSVWPIVWRSAIGLAILGGGLFAFHRVERFLISDSRFLLAPPPEYGMDPPGMMIEGVTRASRKAVLSVFNNDYGRSVYLLPIDKRREELLRIEWIREAAVARFWPNTLLVKIEERVPVAFFQESLARGKYRIWLIDAEGVLMHQPPQVTYRLPVVTGFRADDSIERRKTKVMRMVRLMKDVRNYGAKISEVDTSDLDNLKAIVQAPDSRVIVLWLGDKNYFHRMEDFERSYAEIQRRLPGASVIDMRLDGNISAVGRKGD